MVALGKYDGQIDRPDRCGLVVAGTWTLRVAPDSALDAQPFGIDAVDSIARHVHEYDFVSRLGKRASQHAAHRTGATDHSNFHQAVLLCST